MRKGTFCTALLTLALLVLYPTKALAPELPMMSRPVMAPAKPISRGETVPTLEHRVMRVTAYTASDTGMNGRGITASGERAVEGRTIAADPSIPLGSRIYIPKLGKTYTVTDRGGAIRGNRLDLFMTERKKALKFGVQWLEVYIQIENL